MTAPKLSHASLVYDADLSNGELSVERRTVLQHIRPGSSVLEIGGNTGYFAELLKRRGCAVTTIEIDPRAAARAQHRSDRVIVGDVEERSTMAQIEGAFNTILFMHVLEHMVDPWRVLREVRGLLAEDGQILVLIPNVAGWRVRKDLFFKGQFEYTDVGTMDRTHLRFFDLRGARQLLEDSGYEVQTWTVTDTCVPLERRLSRLPLLSGLASLWHRVMLSRYPNLCGEIFFFRCVPVRVSSAGLQASLQ